MHLLHLELTNFRNYLHGTITPGSYINVLSGENAQGKTNLLESIYFACTGRSFRTLKEKEIINWKSNYSVIRCLLESCGRKFELNVSLTPGQKKIKVNGVSARGYPLEWPGVVLFTPDDLVIIKGSPHERRRFLDLEIGPFDNQYGYCSNRYQRLLIQRNNLLRDIRERRSNQESLQIWDEQLIHFGAEIIFKRLNLLKKASLSIKKIYRELTGGTEEVDVRYLSSVKIDHLANKEEIKEKFKSSLSMVKNEEIEKGQSLIGPHRDDLVFLINGKEMRIYGSQGQQRTIVLALKLALIQMWKNEVDDYPILLLDDVFYELDHIRQNALLHKIKNGIQTFITSVNNLRISSGSDDKTFVINDGKIA